MLSPPFSQTSDKSLPTTSFLLHFQKHCFYIAIAMILHSKSIAIENEITFKNIPEQFVQINNERLSLTFKLTPADNKEILLRCNRNIFTS